MALKENQLSKSRIVQIYRAFIEHIKVKYIAIIAQRLGGRCWKYTIVSFLNLHIKKYNII